MCAIDAYLDTYLDTYLGPDSCLYADTDICRHCHADAGRPANAVCAVQPVRADTDADAARHRDADAGSLWTRARRWLREVCAMARRVE